MTKKTKKMYETLESAVELIRSSPEGWKNYLSFAAGIYKYGFSDSLLIYAQRPDATACASLELWNKLGRRIRAGAKGIPIIDDSSENIRIKYLYDIKDTQGSESTLPKLWSLSTRQQRQIYEYLSSSHKIKAAIPIDSNDFPMYFKNLVSEYAYQEMKKDSPTLDEESQQNYVITLVESVAFTVCIRSGISNAEFPFDSFKAISSDDEEEEFETTIDYFDNEYMNLSENTLSIIQSVVTQMTQFFYTDSEVRSTFSPPRNELNFEGFKDVVDKGKIVILKMNIAQYRNLAKTIAAYMKLDIQSEVMQRLVREGANTERPVYVFADEYQEFVTATDAEFYAQSREAKCITIVATQSYTSLINTLKDRDTVRTVSQNLINKVWLRTDDLFTVEEAQKQTGKEEKEKVHKSISESSGDVKKSRILGALVSDKASISETINISSSREYVFDEKLFTQKLDVFTGICFLSDGAKIIEPTVVYLQPYFGDTIKNGIQRKKKQLTPNKIEAVPSCEGQECQVECEGIGEPEEDEVQASVVRLKNIEQEMRQERIIRLKERGLQHGENKKGKDTDLTKTNDFE